MEPAIRKLKQRPASSLSQGYSKGFRLVEVLSLLTWTSLMAWQGYRLWPHLATAPEAVVAAVLVAYLAADFISGFVHWMADTWGSPETPGVGQALVRPFREHHVDPKAITRHDFIETNGANSLVALPGAVMAACVPLSEGPTLPLRVFLAAFFMALMAWVMATNQFHKWAHADRPPRLVQWLQRLHLVLPPSHHDVHHAAPFAKYYCITTGWLNWPLTKLGFFPALERVVTALTGALPRKDDLGEAAAKALAPEDAPAPGRASALETQP